MLSQLAVYPQQPIITNLPLSPAKAAVSPKGEDAKGRKVVVAENDRSATKGYLWEFVANRAYECGLITSAATLFTSPLIATRHAPVPIIFGVLTYLSWKTRTVALRNFIYHFEIKPS